MSQRTHGRSTNALHQGGNRARDLLAAFCRGNKAFDSHSLCHLLHLDKAFASHRFCHLFHLDKAVDSHSLCRLLHFDPAGRRCPVSLEVPDILEVLGRPEALFPPLLRQLQRRQQLPQSREPLVPQQHPLHLAAHVGHAAHSVHSGHLSPELLSIP